MLAAVWSTKGGVGVSTVAAMLALAQVGRADPALLVDLCGDVPALLGLPDHDGPGVAEWSATPNRSAQALNRIEQTASIDLGVLARGAGPFGPEADPLVDALTGDPRAVVMDCGRLATRFAHHCAQAAPTRILVVRPCYLTLRSVRSSPIEPTGTILVRERGRALGRADVEAVTQVPVLADIAVDIAIARAIDSGLVMTRLPRSLLRSLAKVPLHGE